MLKILHLSNFPAQHPVNLFHVPCAQYNVTKLNSFKKLFPFLCSTGFYYKNGG